MAFKNLTAIIDKAVAEGADQTVAKAGGEDNTPAAGPCNLRLVAYVETGKHEKTYQGRTKQAEQVTLVFEVSGKNHPPIEASDGTTYPHRITVNETLSLHEKARFFKLFQLLNYKGTAKHTAQLLGAAFRGRIVHREYTGRDGKVHKAADLYDKKLGAYTITAPRIEAVDEDGQPTGEYREVNVAPAISAQRCFLWNHADKAQWDSLFIDGEYEERKNEAGEVVAPAKSKNVFQLKITSAVNYKGSPIQKLLANGGEELDLSDVDLDDDAPEDDEEAPAKPAKPAAKATPPAKTKAAKGDPLAGVA